MGRPRTSTRCWPASGRSSSTTRSTPSWVAKIADAFRRAGGDGSIKTLPDAAIHASLKAAGLLGGRHSVTFDDPVAYGMPPTTGYANDPVNTASGNFVELEDDLPFDGLTAGLRFARIYNSRSDQSGAFGPGWSSWADARPDPACRGRRVRRAGRPAGRCSRAWARATGACWASPGLVVPGESGWCCASSAVSRGRSTRPGCRRGSRAVRHRRRASRTRTDGWPSCATAGGRSVRVHWDRRAHRGARMLGRPFR